MGFYINPQDRSKEQWLVDFATAKHTSPPTWNSIPLGELPVVLVHNGGFTAAGIAYDEDEYSKFCHPDERPKIYFTVPIKKLLEVLPILARKTKE